MIKTSLTFAHRLSASLARQTLAASVSSEVLATESLPHARVGMRHACGYSLANKGTDTRLIQDYLGHQNIQHTVRYTKLSANRFAGLW